MGHQMKTILFLASVFLSTTLLAAERETVTVVKRVVGTNIFQPCYPGNREPLAPAPFIKLPIGSITPQGWLRHQLELEADGMTGQLEEVSKWCKFEGNAWVDPEGNGHSGWEEMPYWLKGYGDLGYVLKDERDHQGGPQVDRRHPRQPGDGRLVRPAQR